MDQIDREILELELLIEDYRTARFSAEQIEAMKRQIKREAKRETNQ
jgi:hypothetical protein